jgi:hypothetical protein
MMLTPYETLPPQVLAMLSQQFRASTPASLLLPAALDGATAADLREQLDDAGWTVFDQPTLGRYELNDDFAAPALFDALRHLAERICGTPLRVQSTRWSRLSAGHYAGQPDDARRRRPVRHMELVLDLSAGSSGEAEVHYAESGQPRFVLPQLHRSVALIERPPNLLRYDRYVSFRVRGLQIHRLLMDLDPA